MEGLDVAAHVINRCIDLDLPVSNLKLQKMLYFLELRTLINFEESLISENFQAWQYGPVLRSVYDKYSFFAASSIKVRQEPQQDFPERYRNATINDIDTLANMDVWDLVKHSHGKDTPWDLVYRSNNCYEEIPHRLLVEYAQKIRDGRKINNGR